MIGDPYDNGKEAGVNSLLEKYAVEVCRQLKIPLITRGSQQYPWMKVKPYPHILRSLGCEYSYEYVTEAADRIPFGKYTIDEDLWVVALMQD